MLVRFRAAELRRSLSFSTSGVVHGVLLALIAFGTPAPEEKPKSLYDMAIRPHEKRIVWYHLQDKLPDVRPEATVKSSSLPLRATRKFEQRIVAGAKDDARPPQLVWSPAPEVATPRLAPLPNVLAVEMKRLSRPFTPPPTPPSAVTPKMPDAAPAPSTLAAAPAGPNLASLKKTFTPPTAAPTAASKLPDAAPAPLTLAAAPAGPNLASLKKTFTPPSGGAPTAAAKLPDAAPAPNTLPAAPAGPNLSSLKKSFTAPTAANATAPSLDPDLPGADAPQLAIIGLNPAKLPDLTAPPDSHTAGFSAGPTPHPKGSETDGNASGVAVPGVTVRDGITRQQLLANIRPMAHIIPTGPPPAPAPTRVSSAPDPALEGRAVYTMAIQMPNITSYSGSWMVWYAAREQSAGAMRAPSPLRKVDPKYIASAVADGVEGVVRLGATIRKDGRIEAVRLLRHLDDRLDRSAMEALAKWEFEPARRDAAAVDVDAVFEIPFRLAPKTSK
jgi:TonB family protein